MMNWHLVLAGGGEVLGGWGLNMRTLKLSSSSRHARKLVQPVFNKTYCVNGVYKCKNSSLHVSNVLLVLLVLQRK